MRLHLLPGRNAKSSLQLCHPSPAGVFTSCAGETVIVLVSEEELEIGNGLLSGVAVEERD